MREVFPERNRTVLVAVSFDDRLEALLEAAETLCSITRAKLRLVHVCDPWTKSFLATAVEKGPLELVQTLKDEAVRVATRRLSLLSGGLARAGAGSVETEVLSGDVVKSLAADAEANEVGLIIIGASKGGTSGTSLGFSTAISLIMEATVPVMVLNEAARLPARAGGLKILVADDFTEVAETALRFGFALGCARDGSSLFHVHVENYLGVNDGKVHSKAPHVAAAITPEQIEFLHRQAEERMLTRSAAGPQHLKGKDGHYHLEIVAGGVAEELEKSAIAARADLCVFGQHRVFHRQTMHVGQVPFKAMLAQSRPIVVVPAG